MEIAGPAGSTIEGAFSWLKVGAVEELCPAFPPGLPVGLLEVEEELWSSAWAKERGAEASSAAARAQMENRKRVRNNIILEFSAFLPLLGSWQLPVKTDFRRQTSSRLPGIGGLKSMRQIQNCRESIPSAAKAALILLALRRG
jgi:hypothetical protein